VAGRDFDARELERALKETLKAVGAEMQCEGYVTPPEHRRPHWVFRRMYGSLGLDEAQCGRVIERASESHGERHLWCGLDPEAPRVIEELKREGLLVAVISNTEDGRLTDALGAAEIADRFDLLIDSHLVGCRKPDAKIFHLALGRLGLEPVEAAYVGDSYAHDALAARAVGMRGILLDPLDLHPESVCPRIRSLSELVGGAART
jgi:HAD superfamily hydrolase (TIGR01509 family)